MTRSRAVEVAAGTEAVEAFTAAVPEPEAFTEVVPSMRGVSTVAAIVAACVRHTPSQAALGVPDIQLPVVPAVQATRSRAEGIIEDTDTVRRR
jgi:hypothetical protein